MTKWPSDCDDASPDNTDDNGSESKPKRRTIGPVDLLSLESSPLLNITINSKRPGNSVDVVFVNHKGEILSDKTRAIIKRAALPKTAVLPLGEIDHAFLPGSHRMLLVISVNTKEKLAQYDFCALGGRITRALEPRKYETARVYWENKLPFEQGVTSKLAFKEFVHGLQTPTYRDVDLKSLPPEPMKLTGIRIVNLSLECKNAESIIEYVYDVVIAEHFSRRRIDTPHDNGMNPSDSVAVARRIKERHGNLVHIETIVGEELRKKGLNMLYWVGQGNTHDPAALIILTYDGAGPGKPRTTLVGKELDHDTGGEDAKPAGEHGNMKADMSGGAVALAAFDLIVRRKLPVNVICVLAVADNRISSTSRHPGIVMQAYRGPAVEDGHTDAEGRLAVGDAVRYAEEHYGPFAHMITVATLTGAILIALGHDFAGLFAKTALMKNVLLEASRHSGSPVWHMPLKEARHTKLLKGKVGEPGDICQVGEKPGGAITAAKFILCECALLTENAAHLDIAGMAMEGFDRTGVKAKFSTGYGPELLYVAVHKLQKLTGKLY